MSRVFRTAILLLLVALEGIVTVAVASAQGGHHQSISGFSPASGPVGTEVDLSGDHFRGTKSVTFNETPAPSFHVVSRHEIRATVPTAATTGPIAVARGHRTATSASDFTVEDSATADLWLQLEGSANPVLADSTLTYTLTVGNGGADLANDTQIVDVLPATVIFVSASDGGSYDSGSGHVTWNIGALDAGESATRQLAVKPVHPEFPMSNRAWTTTSSPDPGSPNGQEIETTVNPEPGVHYVTVRDGGLTPSFHSVAMGETVQWDFFGPSAHEITDAHGLGLFDTGLRYPIDTYRFTFDQSAEIRTADLSQFPLNNGKIVVPVQVAPSSGTGSTVFSVTWALSEPAPGLVEDIQIKRPGAIWSRWRHDQTNILQAPFAPDAGPGVYSFRTRMRNPGAGAKSRFGPPVSITVS